MTTRLKALAAVYGRMSQAEIGGRISARAFLEDVVAPYRTESISIRRSAGRPASHSRLAGRSCSRVQSVR